MNRQGGAENLRIVVNWIGPRNFESAAADKKALNSNTEMHKIVKSLLLCL